MFFYKNDDGELFSKGKEIIPLPREIVEIDEEEYVKILDERRAVSEAFYAADDERQTRRDNHFRVWLKKNPDRLIDVLVGDPSVTVDAFKDFEEKK